MTDASNQAIGAAVVAARGPMSQMDVSERMKQLGFKWAQATVWKVEMGERPLRHVEAVALAEVLGVPLAVIAGLPEADEVQAHFDRGYETAMRDVAEFTKNRGAANG